jgi:HEAT repeat protein
MTPSLKKHRPSVQRILADVASLSHDQRYRRMVELGRASLTDAHLAEDLRSLAQSEIHYERLLALMSASGSCAEDLIVTMLADPSPMLASRAARLAARALPDEILIRLMPDLTKPCRVDLACRLWQSGRGQVNDAVYPTLEGTARRHLLSWTTDAFIERHLDAEQMAALDAPQWATLAQRLPGFVRDRLTHALEQSGNPSYVLRLAVRASLYRMLRSDPDAGLSLLRVAFTRIPVHDLPLARYGSLFPKEIAAIIAGLGGRQRIALTVQTLKRLDASTLCELLAADALPNLHEVFPHLNAGQRDALYRQGGEAWREHSGALPLAFVQALSSAARQTEARHAFSLRLLAAEPMARLPYLSCLPFQEALALAQPFLSQPDGELRAQAVAAVVGAGRYEASSLPAILDFCRARENEQDPVRLAMLTALAALPPSRWEAAHLPGFTALIDAALRARDCSHQTMAAATQWLMAIIAAHAAFVAETLPRLVERMGSMGNLRYGYWESRMSDGELIGIAPHLMSLLDTWIRRERAPVALQLIFGFGCRAKAVDRFIDLLADLTQDKRGNVARSGLEALTRLGLRKRAAELIPRLVQDDPSWIQVSAVSWHLHLHRQDLLTPFLSARVYKGRFPSGKAAFLPAFDNGFSRWTAAQQQCYADELVKILTSTQRNAWELYGSVERYAAMPSIDLAPLVHLARLDAPDQGLRDKTLEALGRADSGRGVAELMQALDDNRARVAIYALRRSLMNLRPSQVLDLLARVPRGKVTVAKEIIRLAGDLRTDDAFAFLARIEGDGKLHPDVAIALMRAYWNFLEHPEVWQRLHAAARSEQPALARATIRIPPTGLSPDGQRALSRHLALLLGHADAQVRKETLERLIAMPPGEGEPSLYQALAAQLDDVDVSRVELAASALLGIHARNQPRELASSFAAATRAQSLAAIVNSYRRQTRSGLLELGASASLLVEALLARRWHSGLALRLAFSVLNPQAALAVARQFDAAELMHPGVVGDVLDVLSETVTGARLEALAQVEASLGAERNARMRRIGLSMLCEMSVRCGWTPEMRQRLFAYRQDKDAWVSDAADLITYPDEFAE